MGYELEPQDGPDKMLSEDSWKIANNILAQDFINDKAHYVVPLDEYKFDETEVRKILKRYTRIRFVISKNLSNEHQMHLTLTLESFRES